MTDTTQPQWKLIANLGDVDYINHGGFLVYEDTTGQYAPEVEVVEEPPADLDMDCAICDGTGGVTPIVTLESRTRTLRIDDECSNCKGSGENPIVKGWTTYRFMLEPYTYTEGGKCDYPQYCGGKCELALARGYVLSDNPSHPGYGTWYDVVKIASSIGLSPSDITDGLCSSDARNRALAYRCLVDCHSAYEFDQYPNKYTRAEIEARYKDEEI